MSEIENWVSEVEGYWQSVPIFQLDSQNLNHLAIICDGNRRAATLRNLHPYFGHRVGVETIKGIARAGRAWNLKTLTFWVWSTENWGRDSEQVEFVMNLTEEYLPKPEVLQEFKDNQVRFSHFGRKDRLPGNLSQIIANLEDQTAKFSRFRLNLALDYGGLDEVARAILRMEDGNFDIGRLKEDPKLILQFLDTGRQPLPDLVLRTGVNEGEILHTSGFMPLQTAYSGWAFLPDLFPDLKPEKLIQVIENFTGYEKRLGR